MKFGVVVFPGSNCDDDMIHVLSLLPGAQVEKLWHKQSTIGDYDTTDCIVIPGGFSYGDYLRSGAIARFSPIMKSVIEFAENGGLVFGICNGFQILCEAGLLPGALLRNKNQKFISKNACLRVHTSQSRITANSDIGTVLMMPIAHADGRYYCDAETLASLMSNDQILFKYCDETGQLSDKANVNGSVDSIAGICNESRNVFGMMPHPERAAENILANMDGMQILGALNSVNETVQV